MTFRLAAIDLDGTLLNSAKQLTPRTIDSVRRARRGLMVVICTGRMIRSGQHYWQQLGLDTPIIGYNGAQVKDVIAKEDILLRPVPPQLTREVARFCRERDLVPLLYHDDRLFVEQDCDEVRRYASTYSVEYQVVPDASSTFPNGSTKILLSCEPTACSGLAETMRQEFGHRLNVTQSEGRHVELNDPSATKASAIAFLANRHRIEREEILAFGDGINDVEMLQYAGHGVAMANAWDEAKQAADEVIGDNDEDAVAHFLDSLRL